MLGLLQSLVWKWFIPDFQEPSIQNTNQYGLCSNPLTSQKKGSMPKPPASLVRHLPSFCRHHP